MTAGYGHQDVQDRAAEKPNLLQCEDDRQINSNQERGAPPWRHLDGWRANRWRSSSEGRPPPDAQLLAGQEDRALAEHILYGPKKVPCAWVLTFIVIPKYYCADGRKHLLEVQVSSLRQWEPGWRVAMGRDGRFGAKTQVRQRQCLASSV